MSERQVTQAQQEKFVSTLKGVICSDPGCDIAPVYQRVYDADLCKSIVKKVDETNLFEFIQASKSSTDLATLEKRFIELGEIPGGELGWQGDIDETIMPSNIHEVYAMTSDIGEAFSKLPESVQKAFGNKDAYMKALIDGTYQATLIKLLNDGTKVPDDKIENKEEGKE